jgi:cobalt-zinc-cadmium efflux system outer membrane protein
MGWKILPLVGTLLLCGCLYSGYKKADQAVCDLAAQPFDIAPASYNSHVIQTSSSEKSSSDQSSTGPPGATLAGETDIRTAALLQGVEVQPGKGLEERLKLPTIIPGSETPLIQMEKLTPEQREEYIKRLYPELPELPDAPRPLPGPNGCPLTLDDLQRLAAENSPALKEAAYYVVTAEGNMIQAGMYPNPTLAYENQPTNNNSTAGALGASYDQVVISAGKLKLQQSAAQMDLDNAKLALRRARSDLSTAVRNAYFAVLVSKETVRVNKALAEFTYKVYRISEDLLLKARQIAPYEPAALRAQCFAVRLAYRQAIQTYLYNWEQLRATLCVRALPLTELAGRIDASIPYYDYNAVLAHVLKHHTDMLIAYNGIKKAEYNLKYAQVTPIPNPDVHFGVYKESTITPFLWFYNLSVGIPIPIWDQNRGNILAAQGSLGSAQEEPHRVEMALTNTLAGNFTNYMTNLQALEDYRKFILPDMVRVYRGILERRSVDLAGVAFADLVGAQQTLAAGVAQYLTTLGSLWTAVVSVADLLQTNDLFQQDVAHPIGVAPIPALLDTPPLPCSHPCAHGVGPAHPQAILPPTGVPLGLPVGGPAVLPPEAPPAEVLPRPSEATVAPIPITSAVPSGGAPRPASVPQVLLEPPPLCPRTTAIPGQLPPPTGG